MKFLPKLLEHILLHNFWSFLLILGGMVDIGIGVLSQLTGALAVRNSRLSTLGICLIVGSVYVGAGLALAIFKMRRPPR